VGWWAYRTMDMLGLTPDAIGAAVQVDPATIRKFQGSPTGQLGAESRARLLAFYREVAAAKSIPIDEPPSGFITAGPSVSDGLGSAALLERLDRYADLVDRLVRQNAALMADRGIILRDGSVPAEDLAEIEAAEQAGIGSTSPRRTPARERSAERRSAVRSAG
jgi:hypothetical protein